MTMMRMMMMTFILYGMYIASPYMIRERQWCHSTNSRFFVQINIPIMDDDDLDDDNGGGGGR